MRFVRAFFHSAAGLVVGLGSHNASAQYTQTNLTSDVPGLAAFTDTNLKNPWGVSSAPTSPIWIANQGAGLATLYNGAGNPQALVVNTSPNPTGTVFNATQSFGLNGGSNPAVFIFATLNGTITGWNSGAGSTAITAFTATDAAVYTGLTTGTFGGNNYLYAADAHNGKIDVINATFAKTSLPGTFTDPSIPAGFVPFNVQNIGGQLFVAYSRIAGNTTGGFIDIFDLGGSLVRRLASNGTLDSPWGMTIASPNFGQFSNDFLVGNHADGTIDAFDPITGQFLGELLDAQGHPIIDPGLWSLVFRGAAPGFDPNALYFTAGINGEADGLFGEIQASAAAATPLPAALPLFGSALGVGGFIGWLRRKRPSQRGPRAITAE